MAKPIRPQAPSITDLESMPAEALREVWKNVFKAAPPSGAHRDYLARAIAHRIQEQAYEPLSGGIKRRLLAGAIRESNRSEGGPPASRIALKPGVRLLREWQSEMHEVVVLEKGFMYRGSAFKNLSVIARQITGTRWSGPAFFGLRSASTPIVQAGDLSARAVDGA